MGRKPVSASAREALERLKELKKKKEEAKMAARESRDQMMGGKTYGGKPRKSAKHSTFMPGRHGDK